MAEAVDFLYTGVHQGEPLDPPVTPSPLTRPTATGDPERLAAALAASQIGTFRVDFAANTADWDPNIAPLFGLEGAPGLHVFGELLHTLHEHDRPAVAARFRQCRTEGSPIDMEFRVIWPDGSLHWLAMRASVTRDEAGTPRTMTGALRDVTRIKDAEEALREETRTLEVLNETGKLLAGQLDLERLVQAVTDAATAVSGARYGAFLYNVTDDRGEAYLLYSLSGVPREAFERGGRPPAAALFGATIPGEAPIRLDDLLVDPRFAAAPPPFGLPPDPPPVRSYLAVPVRSRSGDVIGGLCFGHPSPGVFTERSERLVLGVAAQAGIAIDNARLYDQAQRAASEREALLDSERAARAEAQLARGDPAHVEQVVDELRLYARTSASSACSIRGRGRCPAIQAGCSRSCGTCCRTRSSSRRAAAGCRSSSSGSSHLEISVAGTGIGIAADLMPHLFERFRQGDASTTRKYGGLGLGLSLVKSLVELHGGSVRVQSPGEGQGTTVTVTLLAHASELAGLTVLVVDDQPDARDLIARVLGDCGAAVLTAAGAEEAMALLQAESPDVLVSDIGMPETDGYELLRRVRALGPERGGGVPAIALTAFARSEDRTRALRAGFLVHVSKPVDAAELIATVASVARRASPG